MRGVVEETGRVVGIIKAQGDRRGNAIFEQRHLQQGVSERSRISDISWHGWFVISMSLVVAMSCQLGASCRPAWPKYEEQSPASEGCAEQSEITGSVDPGGRPVWRGEDDRTYWADHYLEGHRESVKLNNRNGRVNRLNHGEFYDPGKELRPPVANISVPMNRHFG